MALGESEESSALDGSPGAVDVYLNLPCEPDFSELLLAYIAGLAVRGLRPRTALEITGGERRLDRIVDLVRQCNYSVHDLTPPFGGPRLNMAFELALAVGYQRTHPDSHTWFVFETRRGRIERTLSDLNGSDIFIHQGKPARLFSELNNAFVRSKRQPSMSEMRRMLADMKDALPAILQRSGSKTPFTARVFADLRVLAAKLSGIAAEEPGY
jgi:hypothetical protein